MVNFLQPMAIGEPVFEYFHCDKLGQDVKKVDMYLILRDTPTRSYVISSPCIHSYFNTPRDEQICKGSYDEEIDYDKLCKNNFMNMIALADKEKIETVHINDLRNGKPGIAKLTPEIYWKYIQFDGYPIKRKELFIQRVDSASTFLKKKIAQDLIENKIETRKELLKTIVGKVERLSKVNIKEESKRYSFAKNVGEILSELELIRDPSLSTIQLDDSDSIAWYMYAKTPGTKDQYFVLQMEEGEKRDGLGNNTIYSSGLVNMIGEDVERIVEEESLSSPADAFAKIAHSLDDNRWRSHTEAVKA